MRVNIDKKQKKDEKTILDRLLGTQDEDTAGPIIPAAVELHPTRNIVTRDGREFHDVSVTFKRSDVERMRQGFACLQCWEKLDSAWPEHCPVCEYPVRARQAEDFAKEFEGVEWVGSRVSMATERERLADWADRDRLEKGERTTGILVPDWVRSV